MKHSLTKLFLLITAVALPVFTHAAQQFVTEQTPEVTTSSYVAKYKVTVVPTSVVKVFTRIAEHGTNNWNYNASNGTLTTISPSSLNNTFNASFSFGTLGLVSGKKYIYYLADGGNAAAQLLTNPACFTTTGKVPCDTATPTGPQTLTTNSFTLDALDQTNDPDNAGKYVARFSITPSAGMITSVPLTFKIFKEETSGPVWLKEGNFPGPTVGDVAYPSVDNLDLGMYAAQVYSGATKVSEEIGFKVQTATPAPVGPNPTVPQVPNSPLVPQGGQSAYIGGMTMSFNPADQILYETSAVLKGTVSVQLEMPVSLEVFTGSSPSQIDKSYIPTLQPVSANIGMVPGEVKTFLVPFTGLTKGTTYYFMVRNTATGTQTPVWNFTTKGGTGPIPQSAMTIYDAVTSPYAEPGTFQPVTDTISDKGIVPKCGRTQNADGTIPDKELEMCTYKDFMQLVANVIQYALIIIGPIILLVCVSAGVMIIWLNWQSDPTQEIKDQIKKYYGILVRAVIGLFIIMIAWVIVATVIKELGIKPEFVLLDVFSAK